MSEQDTAEVAVHLAYQRLICDLKRGELILRPEWLDTTAAAKFIGVDRRTLEDWRLKRKGPRYSKVSGRLIRYNIDDLRDFMRGFATEPKV